MRKLKFAFLFVLVLCLVAGVLTACDQAGGTTGTIPIPDDDSTVPGTSSTTLTGSEAWGMFIDSALNANAPTGNYVYADSTIKLGYTRDGNGNSYAFRVIANLDLVNDINSELLIELWRLSANGELEKMLVGTYYTESTLIYDCSGVRQGVSAVKTDNVNLSAIDKTLRELLGDNSLANFILDDLFSFDTGVVGQVGNLVGALFGESSLTTREDGSVHIEMPVSLASILGSALVGLLTPSDTNPIISYEIADIVNDLTGIDLKMMQAMQSTDIVLSADLSAEDENGDRLLTGIDFGIDLDFDTYGTELEKEYGIIRDSISLSVGASAIDKQEAPSFDIKGYLTDDKAAEGDLESAGGRGLDIASLKEYSPLTLDLKLSLGLTHSSINGLTLNDILGAFGTLFNGIITDSVKEQYGWLFDLPIDVGQGNHELYLQIRGGIDMFNADGTNLLIQLGGGESGPLATIGYIGAEESFYVDLSGMLGTGKFSIGGINLNKLLGGLIGELVTMANDALVDAGILTADGGIGTAEQTKELLESGEIVRYFSNSATEDEPIEDTIGLVIAIIESIDTDIDDLFNINEIRIDLSKKILDYIFGLVFTAESGLAGAEIPVDGASLVITNQGFALPKNINIGTALNLTNAEGDPFTLGVNVGITAQFGSVVDQADFDAIVAALPEGSVIALDDLLKKDGKYIFLDENGNLLLDFTGVTLDTSALLNGVLASVGSVGIGLEAGININATEGALASLAYTDATSMMVSVLAQFAESFGVNATLELKAEVVDLAGFVSAISVGANETVDIGALLGGINAYIAIKTADGTAPLELWLKSGVLYLHTADDFLGGLNLKVELSALIGAFSGSASEAVSVADPSEDGTADDAAFDIMGLLKVLLAKITIGDLYVDVDFAADFFYALLETLGVDMASSGISITKPGTEEGVEISGGIKIELPSGLQIADTGEDAGLTIGIGLGLGDNFNLDLSLGGLNASVGGEGGYISDPEESGYEFVDFMASPFVALNLRLDLGAVLDVMNIDIPLSGENLSITIPEGLDIQLGLALRAKLDLRHVFDALLGTDLAQGSANETELALELIANGDNLLAVYYKDNNVYVDAYQLLGARVQLEFNLIDTLLALLGGGAGGASEAVSAAGGGEDEISVFEFLLNITNTGFYLEAVDGLVDVINDALGTTLFNELSLFAELDLSQILVGLDSLSADEPEDEPEYFLNVGVNADGNDIFVKLSGIGLGLGRTADYNAFEAVPSTLDSDDFMSLGALKIMQKTVKMAFAADTAYYYFKNDAYIQIAMATDAEGAVTVADADLAASLAADGASVYTLGTDNTYTEIGVLADATGYNAASIGVDTTAINLESVYVEVSGNITLGVEGGESDLEVGKWIGAVLPADANLSDTVRSFLQRLVLEIAAVEGAQSTRIDFEIKALLRFNPEDMADTGYLLSHSDISLNLLSEGTPLLAVAVIANAATGTSTIYVGSAEGGLISGGLAVPGINLGDLLASTEEDVTEQTEQAIDAVSAADDESVAAAGDDTTNIIGALLGAIGGIYMTDEELEVNLAANGLATLIGALLGVSVSPEEFAQLDPEKSYLSLLYPMRDGMLDLGIALSIGINPVNVGLSLGGLGVAINDSTKTIAPWVPEDETADSYYNNLTDLTGAGTVSFEATLGLEAKFGETSGLEGGVIPVGDIVSAFVTDLALELGLEIDDNLKVGLEAYIGGNFNFASAESIQLMIELRDMYDASNVVLGVYMDGSRIYVNLLGEKFVVENTGIANMIYDAVMGLMADEDDSATGSGEAVAATEGVDPAAEEMIAIVMEIASGRLGLKISERVLVAILSVVVGELAGADSAMTGEDLVAMFESLSLDAEISLDVNLGDEISLEVGVDTKYIGLGIAITNPNLTIGVNEAVANAVSAVVASGEYDSYSDSSYARFGLTLDVSYNADATFIKVTEQEAAKYNQSDRYDLVEGSYVQDSNGTYIRRGISFTEVLAVILENLLGDAGIETGTAILDEMLGALLEALGLDLYIDDIIEDNFRINLKGVLDLEALDLQYMLTNLAQRTDYLTEEEWNDKYTVDGKLTQALPATAYKLEGGKYVEIAAGEAYDGVRYYASVAGFDTMEILNALQAGIEIIFNPEISETVDIGIYLIEGEVYIDTSNIGGPKMMLNLFELLAMLDKMPAGGASEAVTAADEGSDSAIDINALLNALVSAIALRVANDQGTADENGYYNILSDGLALDVLLPSNLLGNLVSMIVGGEGYIFDDFVLAEGSRLSLVLGGGNGLAIQVEASTDTGFTFTVEAKAGLEIDFATTETDILTTSQRGSYTDVSAMVTNIVKLATGSTDGFESMGSQRIKFSVSGKAEFSSDGDASYDLGSLLANYIGDVAIYLSTDEAFSDGIGFRLSVAADIASLGLDKLTSLTALSDAVKEAENALAAGTGTQEAVDAANKALNDAIFAWLESTDYLAGLEIALELLELDAAGNLVTDIALGGIYISGGNLYLDGTELWDIVDNYSYAANFLQFVIDAAKLSTGTAAEAGAQSEAAIAASDSAERNALIELIYSNTEMQIVLTKGVISTLLGAVAGDFAAIADIFDSFEVSLGVEIGQNAYQQLYYLDQDGTTYRPLTTDTVLEEGAKLYYRINGADGYEFVETTSNLRYNYYEGESYSAADDLSGAFVRIVDGDGNPIDTYLRRDNFVIYNETGIVTDLTKIADHSTLRVLYENVWCYLECSGADGAKQLVTYDRLQGYVREANGTYVRLYSAHTRLDQFFIGLGVNVGSIDLGLAIGGLNLEFGSEKSLVPDYILEGKSKHPVAYNEMLGKAYTYENGVYTLVNPDPSAEGFDGSAEIYYYDVPLTPFYDSVVTVGMSVEFELAITEGEVNLGEMLGGLVGDLDGVVVDIPATGKGYSSAHLRLDLTLIIDMQDLPSSQIAIELYNLSSEAGAEIKWLGAYYLNETVYLDLSFFGLPKIAVPMTEIADMLRDLIDDLVEGTGIYDDIEVPSAGEAITADGQDEAALGEDEFEERVAQLLISNRTLQIAVGNAFMRYLLENITLGDVSLSDFVYEQLEGSLDITLDLSDFLDIGIGAELSLKGDRYEPVVSGAAVTDERPEYVFVKAENATMPEEGWFTPDGDNFREMGTTDVAEGLPKYVRHEVKSREGNNVTYYTYTPDGGTFRFDAETDRYVVAEAGYTGTLYTRTEVSGNIAAYSYKAGASANPNDYDTVLTLDVGVGNIDLYFTEQRDPIVPVEELRQYNHFNSADTVSFSETISLDLLFSDNAIVGEDIAGLLTELFPDSSYDIDAILEVLGDDGDVLRNIDLTISLEFKLGAFLNYLRSLDALYGLAYGDLRDQFLDLEGDIDLITFVNAIQAVIGARVPDENGNIYYDNAPDDLVGLDTFLYFINASVVISVSGDENPVHDMLGVYLYLGEGVEATVENSDGKQIYSNFYATTYGDYYFDGSENEYKSIIGGNYTQGETRYSKDSSFLYPDNNLVPGSSQAYIRDEAGLYADLTYLGQPGVFVQLEELRTFLSENIGTDPSASSGASEAIAADGGDGTEGTSSLLPIDLGSILGDVNISDSLPLLSGEIASYITAFVYGIRITSTYIKVLLNVDFMTQLLSLLGIEAEFNDFEQSSLTINVDPNNYVYAPVALIDGKTAIYEEVTKLGIGQATTEQINFTNNRFRLTKDEDGMYFVTSEGYFALRSDMTANDLNDYNRGYYNIETVETYIHIEADDRYILTSEASRTDLLRAETYAKGDGVADNLYGTYAMYVTDESSPNGYRMLIENDYANIYVVYATGTRKAFIEAEIFLWNHSVTLGINLPATGAAEYTYSEAKGGEYKKVDRVAYIQSQSDDLLATDETYYLYYRGGYERITDDNLYRYENSGYVKSDLATFLNGFNADPEGWYLLVTRASEGFSAYVGIEKGKIYSAENVGAYYEYVGAGEGNYNRDTTTSLISYPEFYVHYYENEGKGSAYVGSNQPTYKLDANGNLVEVTDGGEYDFSYDEVHFVATENGFVSVAEYKELNPDVTPTTMPNVYSADYIDYLDAGDLYAINLTIRGAISLGQYVEYLTAEEWTLRFKEAPGDDVARYSIKNGKYVQDKEGIYYAYASSSEALSNILGAVVGDMDALFTVENGYKAQLPFEIRATVMIDYPSADIWTPYIAGMELAIDVWRTEASDNTLTHVLGLYYMSDIYNIGDNDDSNDAINESALYLDLSWIFGDGAKFKIDLTDYPLEALLNDTGIMGSLFGEGSVQSEAVAATEADQSVKNPDNATVAINVFTRSLVLQASAGFIKLVVGLIAPNTADMLEQYLPNLSIKVELDTAPYDLTIGAVLYDETGDNGLLELGITLNLFNPIEPSDGLQISFDSIDDYKRISAERLESLSKDYTFYYGLFSRVANDDIVTDGTVTYYRKDPSGAKGYIPIGTGELASVKAGDEMVYVANNEKNYAPISNSGNLLSPQTPPAEVRYALIPAGYVQLTDAADYALAIKNDGFPRYFYNYRTGQMVPTNGQHPTVYGDEFYPYAEGVGETGGTAKLYIRRADMGSAESDFVDIAKKNYKALEGTDWSGTDDALKAWIDSAKYMPDGNGTYVQKNALYDYTTLLDLDLGQIISFKDGELVADTENILDVLIGALENSGLETVQIGGSLSIDLAFSDIINWTRQMTELMKVEETGDTFALALASLALNSAEFVSSIGTTISFAVQVNIGALMPMLPGLVSGETSVDINTLLPALLAGAQIYLKISYNTNYHGEDIKDAKPLEVWVEVDDALNANIYLNTEGLGTVLGIEDTAAYGQFFGKLKLEGLLNIGDLLASAGGAGAGEAIAAADTGLIIDIKENNTGLLTEDIWGIMDLLLGQALLAGDMLSVGLNEAILSGLIGALMPEFPEDQLQYLPTFKITSGSDTSGVNILVGGGPSVQIQLAFNGGADDIVSVEEAVSYLNGITVDGNPVYSTVYGINSLYTPAEGEKPAAGYLADIKNADGEIVLSTKEYGLVIATATEEAWLGDRYELTFDAEGNPVFSDEPLPYEVSYGNAFSDSDEGTSGVKYLKIDDAIAGELEAYTYESADSSLTYEVNHYMLVSTYERVTDKTYDGTVYYFNESAVVGKYLKLGDLTLAIELGDLSLGFNREFSDGLTEEEKGGYTNLLKGGELRLNTSIDVGFHGVTGADIELGALVDLIFGIDAIKTALGVDLVNNSLAVDVIGDLGNASGPYFEIVLDAYIKLGGEGSIPIADMQIGLTVNRYNYGDDGKQTGTTPVLKVYFFDNTLYADLYGLLGEGMQVKLEGLDLLDLIAGAASEGAAEAVATTMEAAENMTLHDYAYLGALINPGYFSLQLTLSAVQAILAKVGAENASIEDTLAGIELPDIGDIQIAANGIHGPKFSLNAKLSDNFAASLDVNEFNLGNLPVKTDKLVGELKDYTCIANIANRQLGDFTLSASANIDLTMTSEGLKPGDDDYDDSLAGWVIGLITDALGATSVFVQPLAMNGATVTDSEYIEYGGPVYTLKADGTYEEIGTIVSDTQYKYRDSDGVDVLRNFDAGTRYYRTTIVEAVFADNDVNLSIGLEADLNLGAFMLYGIGGLLLSDLKVSIELGYPFNSTLLELYLLGSSRLSEAANNNIYILKSEVESGEIGAYNDAAYINAEGLGLGKIKFQGITSLFGANIGQIYDEQTSAAAIAEATSTADGDTTDATGGGISQSVSIGLQISEGFLGLTIDKALIGTVFGLLDLDFELPDVQRISLGLSIGDEGLSELAIGATVDKAGTGINLALNNLDFGLKRKLDVNSLVNEVATEFAGLTYSSTAGTMTLVSTLLDSLDISLGINVDKRGTSVVQGTNTIGWDAVDTTQNSTVTLTGSGEYVKSIGSYSINGYMLKLHAIAKHPHIHDNDQISLDVFLGNGEIYLDNLALNVTGLDWLVQAIAGGRPLSSLVSALDGLFDFAYTDYDTSTWDSSNPVATTAEDGTDAANNASASTASEVTDHTITWGSDMEKGLVYKTEGHYDRKTYKSIELSNLINKVSVNLFTAEGYQPYLTKSYSGTGGPTDASLISVKVEFTKDGYNELMLFLYCTLLGLLQTNVDTNANHIAYFALNDDTNLIRHGVYNHTEFLGITTAEWHTYQISNLFRELDYIDTLQGTDHEKTAKKVELLRPYAESLPYALIAWVMQDMAGLDLNWVYSVANALGNLTLLIGTILPPFANYDSSPNPSLNLYIDLAPESSKYGLKQEIAPGIQAIELMVNGASVGDATNGKLMTGIIDSKGELGTGSVYYDGSGGTLRDVYILSINPKNLTNGSGDLTNNGEGVATFLEADSLVGTLNTTSGQPSGQPLLNGEGKSNLSIVVDNPATKSATMYAGRTYNSNGTVSNSGTIVGNANETLNGQFIVDRLPLQATVQLLDPSCQHSVDIVWDAGAVDLTAATGNDRLAGYLYGYALNLVVAKIPVYVTDDYAYSSIENINISLTDQDKLPDEIQITFKGDTTEVSERFGTALYDGEGAMRLAALRHPDNASQYLFRKETFNADGVATGTTYEWAAINVAGSDTVTYTLQLYPAYAGRVEYDEADGSPVTVSSADGSAEYCVIKASNSTISIATSFLPVGTIAWDLGNVTYDWDGGTVEIGFTYQWGYAEAAYQTVEIDVESAAIVPVQLGTAIISTTSEGVYVLETDWSTYSGLIDNIGATLIGSEGSHTVHAVDSSKAPEEVGDGFTADIVFYVGEFGILRNYSYDDTAKTYSLEGGFMGNVAVQAANGKWLYDNSKDMHAAIAEQIAEKGYATVAQPVTIRFVVTPDVTDNQGGGTPEVPAGGDNVAPASAKSLMFSDGTKAVENDGELTYEISTAAQLYGAMPTVGTVVSASGKKSNATFDWNGFVYDGDSSANTAVVTVQSAAGRSVEDVSVTVESGSEAAGVLDIANATAGYITKIVDARYRGMAIDPYKYGTLEQYLKASGFGETVNVYTTDSPAEAVQATVVSWNNSIADSDGNFSDSVSLPLAGASYPYNEAVFDIGGKLYKVVVPIVVIARAVEVVDIDLRFDGFVEVYSYNRFGSEVRRYVGGSQVIEVTYSRDELIPTAINIMNIYDYAADNPFVRVKNDLSVDVVFTFADGGGEQAYSMIINKMLGTVDGNEDDPKAYIDGTIRTPVSASSSESRFYRYDITSSNGATIQSARKLEVTFSAVRITAGTMSSPVAYGDLDGIDTGYTEFAPYDGMTKGENPLPTLKASDGNAGTYTHDGDITYYIGGTYIPVDTLDAYGAQGYTLYDRAKFVKGSGNSYQVSEDGTYYFVYLAVGIIDADTAELTFDHSSLSYDYNGGQRRTVLNIVTEEGITGSVTFPVYIVSGKVTRATFTKEDDFKATEEWSVKGEDGQVTSYTDGQDSSYLVADGTYPADGTYLAFDPFANVSITKMLQTGVDEDRNATYTDSVNYKYLPSSATIITASGAEMHVAVTWTGINARNTYAGGDYSARMIIAGPTLTTPATQAGAEDTVTSLFGNQGFTFDSFIRVRSRSVNDKGVTVTINGGKDDSSNAMLPNADGTATGNGTYINPYEFELADFQAATTANSVEVKFANGETVAYTTTDTKYKLAWDFSTMAVDYLGGKVALTARLTGPDGTTQTYEIPYLVQRMLVAEMTSYKGVNNPSAETGGDNYFTSSFGVDVNDTKALGVAIKTFEINPFNPLSQSLPTGYHVKFNVYNPDENGEFTGAPSSIIVDYSYLKFTMPSSAKITAEKAQKTDNAGYASVQLGSGQRIRIPLVINGKVTSARPGAPTAGGVLTTSVDGVTVVWHGTRTIKYNAGHDEATNTVTFTQAVMPPTQTGRTVTYTLTAYIGAVVDAAGNVIDWAEDGTPACQSKGITIKIAYTPGSTTPVISTVQ